MHNKKNRIFHLLAISFFIISTLFAFGSNFSLESKYGQGTQVLGYDSNDPLVDSTYTYNEHILDINFNFNSLYFYSQFEYSKPPVFGKELVGLNNFYLEYETDIFRIKAGDIYTLYGRGLSINMFQDQVIDYDNSLIGIESIYSFNEKTNFYYVIASSEIKYMIYPQLYSQKLWINIVDIEHIS